MAQFGLSPSGNMTNFQPPTYNPLAGPGFMSNPMFQMAMAMYLPQAMGQGNFLPSLMPSQHLFDQFTAAKYQNARMEGMKGPQALDQQALTTRMLGIQAAMSDGPMTAMNVEQASNMASIANHPLAKMVVSQLIGPENMEDLYYGRRGSADMLYQSVAKSGFHRRDPTGGERMSGESLSGMTREMYAQMYGPDADLSEMNGLSAGRAGALYDDLFRRGVLPQSVGNLKPADRVKAIAENLPTDDKTMERLSREYSHEKLLRSDEKILDGKRYAELTPQQQQAEVSRRVTTDRGELESQFQDIKNYNAKSGKKSIGEIEQMDGFGVAARSIDAQKASNTLKQYSGAIAAVREIFGDNGNPNAPMQQLITALEALTQNQIGRVSPKKIEQQVREMQMAARGAGVGLNGMMALSSQAAAFGDQLGLDRSFANSSALAGMRQGEAMRNAGALNRGFGGMSQEEAMVKGAYLESAAAASPVGNMIGVAVRTVKEDPSRHYDKDGKAITPVGALVQALERGDTTYVDPKTGKTVDIEQGIADKQGAFVREALDQTEDKVITEERMMDTQGNQEYSSQIKGLSRLTQRADIIGDLGATFGNQLSLDKKGFSQTEQREIGQATAAAVMATHSGIAPEKRAEHMRDKIMQKMIETEETNLKQSDPTLTDEDRRAKAEAAATTKFEKAFGTAPDEQTKSMQRMLAQGNRMLTAVGRDAGMTMFNLKDFFGSDVQENKARIQAAQERRAELMGDFGDTQSTMLQRFSDVLGGLGSGNKTTMQQAVQAMLGIIPNERISEAMTPGAGAMFELAGEEYRRGIITSEEELIDLRRTAQGSDKKAAAEAKEKLRAFAGEKGKSEEDVQKLFELAAHTSANKKVEGGENNIRLSREMVRGIELGGSAGVSRASNALAQSLLGINEITPANEKSVSALADALRSGDEKKITALLPGSITGDDKRMEKIRSAAGLLRGLDESGRGLGETDSQAISDARLRTVRDIVNKDNEVALQKTEEGKRLVAMANADAQGNYTLDGKKYNVHTELGGGEKADAEKFKRDMEVATAQADQKTKDKVAGLMKEGAADPAQQMAAVGQQIAEGLQAAMGGGISSANITIQNLESLSVQNATGMKLPEGTAGRITGSADVGPQRTPASVAAAVDAQTQKKRDTALEAHDAAMAELGQVAQAANVSLQDLISGKADLSKLPDDIKAKASAAVEKANETAKTVNDLHSEAKGLREDPAAVAATKERKKQHYARLGVTDSVTPQQKEIIDSAVKDPTGTRFGLKMLLGGEAAKEAMFTLPDDAAVELFSKFNPEAQKMGLEKLKEAENDKTLTPKQRDNAARLYHAILAAEKAEQNKEQTAVPAARSAQEEIEKASQISQKRGQEKVQQADEARKQVKASVQIDEQKKLEDLDTTMKQSWSNLKPSQKAEVDYLQNEKKSNEARAVLEDPNATPAQKEAATKTVKDHTDEKNQKDIERIVAMQMAEEQGIDTSSADFKVDVQNTDNAATTKVTAGGKRMDQYEFLARVKQYDAEKKRGGVSDEALTHMSRVQQKDEQENFVKGQAKQATDGQQEKKQTEDKQQQAEHKADEKQRDVAMAVPTIDEQKEIRAKVEATNVMKQVTAAEFQTGQLYPAGGAHGGQGGGQGGGEQEITGTLQLRGLTEVLLNARSKQMELPPENGPPIDMAHATQAYV